jgi:hypothetical protein
MFVLTAYNPMGRRRPDDENVAANLQLAARLLAEGAGIQRARGSDLTRTHVEPSFLAWGISRDEAVAVAREFSQDAIFELTAETVTVISCVSDRATTMPRLGSTDVTS